MNNQEENVLFAELERRLEQRKTKVRNKAALGALVKIIPYVGTGLHHALTGGSSAESDERTRIELDLMAELLVRIDAAISEVGALAQNQGVEWTEVGGTIRLKSSGGESATGVHISEHSGQVRFQQGTEIDVETEDVRHSTSLHIGRKQP